MNAIKCLVTDTPPENFDFSNHPLTSLEAHAMEIFLTIAGRPLSEDYTIEDRDALRAHLMSITGGVHEYRALPFFGEEIRENGHTREQLDSFPLTGDGWELQANPFIGQIAQLHVYRLSLNNPHLTQPEPLAYADLGLPTFESLQATISQFFNLKDLQRSLPSASPGTEAYKNLEAIWQSYLSDTQLSETVGYTSVGNFADPAPACEFSVIESMTDIPAGTPQAPNNVNISTGVYNNSASLY